MNPMVSLARAMWLGFVRDRMALFFVVLFPLMFLVLFGGIFSSTGQSKSKLIEVGQVTLLDSLPSEARQAFDQTFEVQSSDDLAGSVQKVRDGDVDAVLVQQGNVLVLHFSKADQVKAATVRGTLGAFVDAANVAATGKPPTYTLNAQQVEDESLKSIQYVTPGLLGWAVATSATFGAALTLVQWRNTKLLRRLRLAPVSTRSIVFARVFVSVGVALLQMAIFLGLAVVAFGLKLTGSWWMGIPLVVCGTLAFMAIGLLAGSFSKTSEGASGVANLIVLPMAFLAGSFIPLSVAPAWLRGVSHVLPLRYLNEGMLDVMVRGKGPGAALVPMAILVGFALVVALIATRLFRWESD